MSSTTNAPDKLIIGLTGGIGSGKTSVANAFAARGASVIDTDAIAHQLTAPDGGAITAIAAQFGKNMITAEGALDRAKMRELIFSDKSKKRQLESILHPMIRDEVSRQSAAATGQYIIYVVPLLVETGHWKFSRILVIDCDEDLQIQRVMQRDGLAKDLIQSIIAQQASRAERLAIATDVLQNQGSFEMLLPEIDRLHKLYCQLSASN
ncbi:dephospho-CoA kinase [Oxalobacteraceae bacterium GrIS 2.11]